MKGAELQAERTIDDCVLETYDLIVVPGGKGAETLGSCKPLIELLAAQRRSGRLYGGICAAPFDVLFRHQLIEGPMTCFPELKQKVGGIYREEPVVVTKNCVTSQGPGTALQMGVKLVELLRGEHVAQELKATLVMDKS